MGRHQVTDEQWAFLEPMLPKLTAKTGRPPGRSASDARRLALGSSHRTPLAGPAPAVWTLANRLSLLHPLAQRRHLQSGPHHAANPPRQAKQDRLGPVGHRRLDRPGRTLRGRGFKKSRPRHGDKPADHALGRCRGGFASKFHLVVDSHGLPTIVELSAAQPHDSMLLEEVMDAVSIPQRLGRPPQASAASGRRQGIQLPTHPRLAAVSRDRGGHPPTRRSACPAQRPASQVRQAGVPQAKNCRAVHRLVEGVPPHLHPLREAGD
jgi:hypothetical protein